MNKTELRASSYVMTMIATLVLVGVLGLLYEVQNDKHNKSRRIMESFNEDLSIYNSRLKVRVAKLEERVSYLEGYLDTEVGK